MTDGFTGGSLPENNTGGKAEYEKNESFFENASKKDDQNALTLIREDLGRQLGLASDRQNTMLQSIGVMVAFASILFLQLLAMEPVFDGYGVFFIISLCSVLFCCIYGVFAILSSSNFALLTGMGVEEAKSSYENDEVCDIEATITNGMDRAYEAVYRNNANLIDRLTYMVALLMVGVFAELAGWCLA
ncbi:MAG: hypothetical protein FWG41_03960 [Methanomassiliicoccaceae archaeon]|nr:hypothetical protein [Methanomassiliicoccaceae archaeon]